jgi:hypothetical protein
MRWQQLFADLQAQFDEEEAAAERSESASRARAEMGAVRLCQRLLGSLGAPVSVTCRGVGQVGGVLVDVGSDWLLLEEDRGRQNLVATAAVRAVAGLGRGAAPPEPVGAVRGLLDLRRAMRALARDRAAVQVVLDDGGVLSGTLDRVGADYVELAEHPTDQPRRAEAVQGVRVIVISAVAVVRTGRPGFG